MLYYAKSTGYFYDSDIHGARTLAVSDPSWVRPAVKTPDPTWSAPVDAPQAVAPLIDVPDLSASAPTLSVPNPDCQIPADAIEITLEEHRALLSAQSKGKVILAGPNGRPVAVDPPPPTTEERSIALRLQRDQLLHDTEWMVVRHREQMEAALMTSLSADQFKRLLVYRQTLRDVPEQQAFPDVVLPELPVDLGNELERDQ